jgi:hypothetical protein
MQVKLKRALLVDRKFYQPGVQDIPEEALKHPHFVRYISLGIIVAPENEEMEKLETPVERAQRLAQLEKEREAKKQELLKKVSPPAEPEVTEPAPIEGKKKSKKG